jgi:TusA-related sulfurtransferase
MATDHGGPALPAAAGDAHPATGKVVRYDCGWLGCDEIPLVVRRQFQALDVGDIVEFLVYEASSKEDTPSFCRLLGQRILSTEPQADGGLLIRVERAR